MDLPTLRPADDLNPKPPLGPSGEWRAFLARVLRHPRTVGAVAPSSPALARAMIEAALPLHEPVLELGAGTGVFSRALLRAGVEPARLHAVECLPEFVAALRSQLPGVRVLEVDAAALTHDHFAQPPVSVVSGLPLRAMPEDRIEAILRAVLACCRADVRIVQFSYGLRCPVPQAVRERLGLQATRMGWVAANLPPAWVWRLQRDPASVAAGRVCA